MNQSSSRSLQGKSVAIIGAGIAGLAASIRLACLGAKVDVFDANSYPGGKLSEIMCGPYRFDAGPSLFTMPQLVEELFHLAGEKPEEHFQYRKLDVSCHYFYEDGTHLKAYADREAFCHEIEEKTGEPGHNVHQALENSAQLYQHLAGLFMYRSLHKLSTWTNRQALEAYSNLHKLDFLRTMHGANSRQFTDPRIVQLFNRYATYNGSDPYQTPATLNIIPHLEYNLGAYFPEKGMYSITTSLYALAQRLGVSFRLNTPVTRILVNDGKIEGIATNHDRLLYDRVLSNMDVVNTYRKLLPDIPAPKRLLNQPKSSSALIFYWGISRSFSQLDLHNIFFSTDYKAEFEAIFRKGGIHPDPTVYVNITSKYKPDDAPKGCENWFTMINVPNNTGQDWDSLIAEAKDNVLQKLSRMLQTNIAPLIACEEVLDPRLIESRTSSSLGALYGNSSNNRYAAFLRHANFSHRIKGLYFCGGSVHPGGGIPLSILSARLAVEVMV